MLRIGTSLCILLLTNISLAQQTANPTQSTNPNQNVIIDAQTIVVTGTFQPVPLSETNRSVVTLELQKQPLLFNSMVDAMQSDPSIDLQQRASGGEQADLSIRGATFEQSLVMVNGLRLNDAQTGHHDMDLPFPIEAVSRIEVLHGAGSTLYGADAMAGAVNLITTPPLATEFRARVGIGNFGFNEEHVAASLLAGRWSERITASRDFSTGFQPDRDYRSSLAASETYLQSSLGSTDILLAGSDRPFGADQFYGDFPSWERTKTWFASISQNLGKAMDAAFAYRRHSDEFILERDDPTVYENNHISQSWQADLRRRASIRNDSTITYGVEANGDQIDSNNLGLHARNREAGYVNLDFRPLQRLSMTIGAREEGFSGGQTRFLPSVAAGFWLGKGVRLRASASRAFRLPTYTDLYYTDPANIGNPLLKPESAWDFEGGPEWNPGGTISAQLTGFARQEHDDIDYVRTSPSSPWQATNINYIQFLGVEAAIKIRLPKDQELELAYTALHADQQLQPGLTSKYVFNFPSNNATFSWTGQIKKLIDFRTRVRAVQRVGQTTYALWDLSLARSRGTIQPYLQLSNLSNTSYADVPGVVMPGRTITGGLQLLLRRNP